MKNFDCARKRAREAYCTRRLSTWFGMTALIMFAGVLVLPPFIVGVVEPVRELVASFFPILLLYPLVTVKTFYIVSTIVYVIVAFSLLWWSAPVVRSRNRVYLLESLYSDSERAPVAGFDDMIKRAMGDMTNKDDETSREERSEVERMLLKNIEPIEDYIKSTDFGQNVLIVEGAWGVGKTSNVLVAIDRLSDDVSSDIRYIYESAFKYNANIGEFKRDVLKALYDVLAEMKIYVSKPIGAMIGNITADPAETLMSVLKNMVIVPGMPLTTDLVNEINEKYRRARDDRKLKVVIVLDDLDRLQGEDILSALAFLSIVRRLEFVKIILPLSLKTIGAALENANVPEPRQFIQKYLPENSVVAIKSGMDVVERIALQKIKGKQLNPPSDGTEFRGAWAAMLIKKVSNWLDDRAASCGWDGRGASEANDTRGVNGFNFPDKAKSDSTLCRIIERSYSMMRDAILRTERGLKYGLDRPGRNADLRRFEDVILKVRKGPPGHTGQFAVSHFDEDDYWAIIASWIFKFAENYWEDLEISLRSMLDIINDCDLTGLSLNKAEQFIQVFNQLFPDALITYDS